MSSSCQIRKQCVITDKGRECADCREFKPWAEYSGSRGRKTGHHPVCRSCDGRQRRERARAVRLKVVEKYGGECVNCGCDIAELLCIDHINDDGAEKRKNSWHSHGEKLYRRLLERPLQPDLQLLCQNCNSIKQYFPDQYAATHCLAGEPKLSKPRFRPAHRPVDVFPEFRPVTKIVS